MDGRSHPGDSKECTPGHTHWLGHEANRNRTHFERHANAREFRRERTLREWFGSDRAVEECAELRPPARLLGDLVTEALAAVGLQASETVARVQEQWTEIVGADVAAVTVPRALRRNVLQVEVSNETWRFVLNYQHRARLRHRLAECFPGEIKDVRFIPPGRFVEES